MKHCNSCGKCCIKYGNGRLSASEEDLQLWEAERPDIDRYVKGGDIWVSPETGKNLEHCPWLQREVGSSIYTCAIYYDRPEDCRVYPATLSDMIKDDCEMLEPQDLSNTKLAQQTLKRIMIQDA